QEERGSANEPGVEIIGWLELLTDDSAVVILSGMHDGALPGGIVEHAWLPQSVRMIAGIEDYARRVSRDLYLFHHLLHSREAVYCHYSRRNSEGEFLRPSSLLLYGPNQTLPARARMLYLQPGSKTSLKLFGRDFGKNKAWQIDATSIVPRKFKEIPITGFREYLRCPYRFYLRYGAHLQSHESEQHELGAFQYGNLLHELLDDFAASAVRQSGDPKVIRDYLIDQLRSYTLKNFGAVARPAVQVQMYLLERRLLAFAERQAQWTQNGWEIREHEFGIPKCSVSLAVDGGELYLTGRIDRIDYHSGENKWMAIDYKSSQSVNLPQSAHFDEKHQQWKDLQLPLYREALLQLGYSGGIETAYFSLPADSEGTDIHVAQWSEQDYESARSCAQAVAQAVAVGKFWPPSEEVFAFDDFADLLGVGQYTELLAFESAGVDGADGQ
ncbi:MAG: PD-(D/E)XK nuclease family protein, partial [Bdellovibrionales bacterium]|nr:PD-(D/E)XK nuclease family protein [Bdellovibrionales bacterium]